MQEGWNYLEVMKNKKTLASRLGNIVGKQGHDAKHSQSTVLELLKLELSLHFGAFVDRFSTQEEGGSEVEIPRCLSFLIFPSNELPVT